MRPVYGHKGKLAMRCHIHGKACHSAYAPDGVNAIEYAAKLITRLGVLGKSWRSDRTRASTRRTVPCRWG
jgi:acetylornithine deacetylase